MKRSTVLPTTRRRKAVEIEQRSAVYDGVADLDDAAKADQVLVVDLIVTQQLGVVAEVAQKPVELPQRFRRAVETSGKECAGECFGSRTAKRSR